MMPGRLTPEILGAAAILIAGAGSCMLLRTRRRRIRALAGAAVPAAAIQSGAVRGLVLRLAALAFIFVALLQPRWGEHWETIEREGLDLMIILDVSRSMWAEDVAPNRLERARWELAEALPLFRGDRIGLVAFAGDAAVLCPLTTDTRAFALMLDDARPERIARGGTALPPALRAAMDAMGQPGEADRALLVISDGENHEGDPAALTAELRDAGMRVFCIGVGAPEGAPIPLPPEAGGGFVRDREGRVVRTRLDEQTLRGLAEETGGAYVRATPEQFGLERLITGPLAELRRARVEVRPRRMRRERFQLFLLAALVCLLLEWRPVRRSVRAGSGWAATPVMLLAALLASGAVHPDTREARYWMAAGGAALERGDWPAAAEAFERAAAVAPSPRLDPARARFNAGLARARGGEHDVAAAHFERALESPDHTVQTRAHLHAGGSLSRLADAAAERGEWTEGAGFLERAIRGYEEAIRLGLDEPEERDVRERLRRESRRLAEFRRRAARADEPGDEPGPPPDIGEPTDPKEDPPPDMEPDDPGEDPPATDAPPVDGPEIPVPPEAELPELSEGDAQRILDALLEEEHAHRVPLRPRADPAPVEKDW